VTADYGFNREHILNIQLSQNAYEKTANAFTSVPGVERVSGTSDLFGFSGGDTKFIMPEKVGDSLAAAYFSVTPSFIPNMGLKIIAGENLPATASNKAAQYVLVNEEAYKELRFKNADDAVGRTIWLNDGTTYIIRGVVKDFHYASFLRSIQPMILANNNNEINVVNILVSKSAEQNIIPLLQRSWKQLYPSQPFEADWFDKALYDQHLHKDDLVFIGLLTAMALSIACLGLLGMVIYTAKNRSKEVSIRRVMGAGLGHVVVEISKEFIVLLLLAVCIGLPIGFIAGKQFLQQYVYRIPLGFGILATSATILLIIGGVTIGFQTYRTALINPAKNLRAE
jgi:putative ABC transport system permease protein